MHIVVHGALAEINVDQWNALLPSNNPFMRYEFLHGLETSRCVSQERGWEPAHVAIYEDKSAQKLLAAMPAYIKTHSYGEYIFDWAWADAHHRHGLDYYPKLSNAVPFTPATGERWLVSEHMDSELAIKLLVATFMQLTEEREISSIHSLFTSEEQAQQLGQHDFLIRHSSQFHWQNKNYDDFDDFLAGMNSKKRKNIKRERRRVKESGIRYRWLTGSQLDENAVDQMYAFYKRTIAMYGAQSYLNKPFFDYLADSFSQQTLFLFADYCGPLSADNIEEPDNNHQESNGTNQRQVIAGGLYFKSDNAHNNTLYGRYWGALDNFHSVHFETCYYQAIDWCIQNGFQRFEAGAQGEHKLARGLEPSITYSAHWIKDQQFHKAIDEFLQDEQNRVSRYTDVMQQHSPFKNVEL